MELNCREPDHRVFCVTLVLNVPVLGDKDDQRYEGILKAGFQLWRRANF